ARDRREVTSGIQKEADRLSGGGKEDLFAFVTAAAHYVRDSVRYLDIELGVGGYQPHAAGETLSNLYGDCKDKATLLSALLAAREIVSYPVLVNLTMRNTVAERFPVGMFNHLVLAVPLREGFEVPAPFAAAVVDAGELGRLFIVDVTDERSAIGSISGDLAGKRALVVAGTRGRVIDLPAGDASSHAITRKILARPDGTGRAIERVSTYSGDFAAAARHSYSSSANERRLGLERRMRELYPSAAFGGSEVSYETPDGHYIETIRLGCASIACSAEPGRIDLFPGAAGEVDRVSLGKRTMPVQYDHPFTIRYEARYEGLPQADLPAARRIAGEGWSVETTCDLRDGAVESSWEVRLDRTRFEPEAFAELRRFWAAVAATGETSLRLDGPRDVP
ncbi:MAG TPA: hypothetical protein VFG76_00750, partial [Candidatus Polarisedimenticolia bacterium]|nr:hypothetical protein [Candidatus Polarisedimenticolia bacterium]